MLNLMLWAYSLALQDSQFAPVIFLFVQLMFQGLRELSIALSDPFGDDATDFPIGEWMSQLYRKLQSIVEHSYDMKQVKCHQDYPLHKLKDGEMLFDVLVDARHRPIVEPPKGSARQSSRRGGKESSSEEDQEEEDEDDDD